MSGDRDTPGEELRLEILPVGEKELFVDQFWSGMYNTLCSFAQTEARLVWMRYSAFLVVHGLLFNFVKENNSLDVVFFSGILGLVLCIVWAFLNHCGWKNQNVAFEVQGR